MAFEHNSFISKPFLRSLWALDYEAYKDTAQEKELEDMLRAWAKRSDLKETSAESAFIDSFFKTLWGYKQTGQDSEPEFSLHPKFSIPGAGPKGGTGLADLAMGWFSRDGVSPTPQILCEFKDITSSLDAPQKRRSDKRSPVKQCLDYLGAARRGLFGNEAILPTWGIVTDMNEFRLYWYDRAPQQFFRFVIRPVDLFQGEGLLADTEIARFDRFLFWRLFNSETLLTTGGRSKLEQLIAQQWVKEREIENTFYKEYRAFREKLYQSLLKHNPDFPGTKGRLVRIAQKILDRFIFIFYCEDMGQALSFPPQILRDFLIDRSNNQYFDPNGFTIWSEIISLFKAMNEGRPFGGKKVNQFNGGLFADDPEMESLTLPNSVFCHKGQGQNEASLNADKQTVLYLSAAYNYASDFSQSLYHLPVEEKDPARALKRDPSRSLGLYTLGRIFEQSITELEILEAEADGLLSVNKESKRKRDGVYYTPEWVVERIVLETLGPRLEEIKSECSWPDAGLPDAQAIDQYQERLKTLKVVDPACGSGAFLITVLRFLMDEWHSMIALRRDVTGKVTKRDDDTLIKDILRSNIYGVDINPASVEITRLALWLHTASGDKPLSSLDHTIRDGNSLIGPDFYKGQIDMVFYDDAQKERVNTFDWKAAFPEVFDNGGFDAIIGNPPYVKLQNFRKVHADMAEYLKTDRLGHPTYKSTQTGNFDLYLPFIEKGLQLLGENGRLGYIAPSLWTVNKYGSALRALIADTRQLERWIDFRAFQVFDEAITYTALQFYTKRPNNAIKVVFAPDGKVIDDPWQSSECELPYDNIPFDDRWLLLTGKDRALVDKLLINNSRLDNKLHTETIFQGVKTGADPVYKLQKIAPQKYICKPKKQEPYEVSLEDDIMFPIISGNEAKRYLNPESDIYLLFPYEGSGKKYKLIDQNVFQDKFPMAWRYLSSWKKLLIKRDDGELNNEQWYRFSRSQSLDKKGIKKLIAAGTVPSLRFSYDEQGLVFLTGGRADGVVPSKNEDAWFLLGILNAPVVNFVFRRIGRVKAGGYFEANKQFITPLPITKASEKDRNVVSGHAKSLQTLYTKRRDIITRLEKRMGTVQLKSRPETFLFPDLKAVKDYVESAPKNLLEAERKSWAKQKYEEDLQGRYDEISDRIHPAAGLDTDFKDGELRFSIDGIPVLENIFLDKDEGAFILAQWKVLAQTFPITDKTDGKKLCNALRKLAVTDNNALVKQIIELEGELTTLETEIAKEEQEINQLIYTLYSLNEQEIKLIKNG
ncbi:MAG TPA: restriction endonuclease subunit M [Holosporales bacterium]|nr:restriction endonuclease subunit M [Holosporales bacterium]